MRFFHISDLHIGKQLNGYSLRENQEQVLSQILSYAEKEKPDAVLICGDIYDKSVPSGEAHIVFDGFLNGLARLKQQTSVFIIAGNHDSPERLSYASAFLEQHHIYISVMPPQSEEEYLKKITLHDVWGRVHFYLFPFMKPGYIRMLPGAEALDGYDSAFRMVLSRERIDPLERNVILAHQFFTNGISGPETCDSEQLVLTVGGTGQVDCLALGDFDYAALGHLHGPQKIGRDAVRYSGSPSKYSASEEHHSKSIALVTMEEKGKAVKVDLLPLTAPYDVRRERGGLNEIIERATEEKRHDFVSITITDEEEPADFREKLEEVYDHILEIRIDNLRTRERMREEGDQLEIPGPYDAFRLFFEAVHHIPLTKAQEKLMKQIVEVSGEEER